MPSIQSYVLRFLLRRTVNWNKPLSEIRDDLSRVRRKVKLARGMTRRAVDVGGVSAEWLIPSGSPENTVLLYLHGGGFCVGVVQANRHFAATVAQTSGFRILMPDYRLAPENPYPAALDDTIAVYEWMLAEGYSNKQIALIGDSSGGGLCLSTLLVLRDRGLPMPATGVCLSPVTDMLGTGESMIERAAVDPFALDNPLELVSNYVAGHDPAAPYLSPLNADLSGLPPLLIHAAGYDVFLSDAIRFAEKARRADVDVSVKVWDKMWHIFHFSADVLPEARWALRDVSVYLHRHMKGHHT